MNDPTRMHEVLSVLAPPRRFELAMRLLEGTERSVSQLAESVGLSQSCTTRHLQALERVGLVRGTRDGKRVVFRIQPVDAVAASVLAALHGEGVSVAVRVGEGDPPRRTARTPSKAARAPQPPAAPQPLATPASTGSPVPSPDPPESGIQSPTRSIVSRRQDLEDFLL